MNTLTIRDWNAVTSSMDAMLLLIWLLTLLIIASCFVISKVVKLPKIKFKLSVPEMTNFVFWGVLMTVAIILRLINISKSAWYDEAFTGVMASVPLDRFMVALRGDVHPPLFYLLAKLSVSIFGYSDAALRLPSLLSGLLIIPAMYRLAFDLSDKGTARLTAVIVALLPAMIHYSNEARYPMMLALAIVIAMIGIIENKPIVWAVALAGAALLHATGIIYATALSVLVTVHMTGKIAEIANRRIFPQTTHEEVKPILEALLGSIFVGLVIGPTLELMLSQAKDVANGFWLWQMNPLTHFTESTITLPSPPGQIIAYVCVVALTTMGSIALWRLNRARLILLAVTAVPFAVWVIGELWHPVYLPRAMLAPALIMVIGWAILAQRNVLYQLLLIAAMVISIPATYQGEEITLKQVFSACNGASVVFTSSTSMGIAAHHYAPSGSRVLTDVNGNSINQSLPESSRLAMGFDFTPVELVPGDVCMVVQWNGYMTPHEKKRIDSLRNLYSPTSQVFKTSEANFSIYEVLRWTNAG